MNEIKKNIIEILNHILRGNNPNFLCLDEYSFQKSNIEMTGCGFYFEFSLQDKNKLDWISSKLGCSFFINDSNLLAGAILWPKEKKEYLLEVYVCGDENLPQINKISFL